MKVLITLTVVAGWLLVELKEFYKDGGFSNTLAMDMLRIIMSLVLLVTITGFIFLTNLFGFMLKMIDKKTSCGLEAGMNQEPTKRILKTKSFYLFDQTSNNEDE
jgi:hypothetical protein